MIGSIIGIFMAVIGVAALGVFLGSGNTSKIISAIFTGFQGALGAAKGA